MYSSQCTVHSIVADPFDFDMDPDSGSKCTVHSVQTPVTNKLKVAIISEITPGQESAIFFLSWLMLLCNICII